jgi:shikimate kinase
VQFQEAIQAITSVIDPALRAKFTREITEHTRPVLSPDWSARNIVLVGHRAAGKTGLLPILGSLLGRRTVDLDAFIESRAGRTIAEWVKNDTDGFRRAERQFFQEISPPALIAVGGGFLSNHADVLKGHVPVLVPITFETYRQRLLQDETRPRLRPNLSLEEEIETVFREREKTHAQIPTISLVEWLRIVRDSVGS